VKCSITSIPQILHWLLNYIANEWAPQIHHSLNYITNDKDLIETSRQVIHLVKWLRRLIGLRLVTTVANTKQTRSGIATRHSNVATWQNTSQHFATALWLHTTLAQSRESKGEVMLKNRSWQWFYSATQMHKKLLGCLLCTWALALSHSQSSRYICLLHRSP
jgi:hypothetical protein